jgi:hypothetical protein
MTDPSSTNAVRARSEGRRFARDLALLLGIPFVIVVGLVFWWGPWRTYHAPSGSTVFDVVAGTWDWEGAEGFCETNPHTVAFSPDRKVMILTHKEPWEDDEGTKHQVTEYDIQEHEDDRIRGLIRGEPRRTDDGHPVVWDLVLVSADGYRWRRTDWPLLGRTNVVKRCTTP